MFERALRPAAYSHCGYTVGKPPGFRANLRIILRGAQYCLHVAEPSWCIGGNTLHFIVNTDQSRVHINEEMLGRLVPHIFRGELSAFARAKGLPYSLIYNVVHGRVKTISARDYETIFGEKPPAQQVKRVDGEYFRGMVRLWLFLNHNVHKRELYKEFYPEKEMKKVDSRIFSGKVRTIEGRLEKMMEQKFFDQGLQRPEIETWIEELRQSEHEERVPYEEAQPLLAYLQKALKISPSSLLHQRTRRYESGELKTISMDRYDDILLLKKQVEQTLRSGSTSHMLKHLEAICGRKNGMTLFSEIEDELDFLQKYGTKGIKKYLGRSVTHYKKSKLRRIAAWRSQKIQQACNELVGNIPQIKLASLPKRLIEKKVSKLVAVLKSCLVEKLIKEDSQKYERLVLMPSSQHMEEYKKEGHGFTPMDHAAPSLGMSKTAFDLMVGAHASIFRRIARYEGRWYLSNLYIEALNQEERFKMVRAKYALLVNRQTQSHESEEAEGQDGSSQDQGQESSKTSVMLGLEGTGGVAYHLSCAGLHGEPLVTNLM